MAVEAGEGFLPDEVEEDGPRGRVMRAIVEGRYVWVRLGPRDSAFRS